MSDLATRMMDDAVEAQKFSRRHLVLELDFSAASIREIEEAVATIDFALQGGRSPENVEQLTRLWGSYLGETIRRATTAEWVLDETESPALRQGDQMLLPHQQVKARLTGGDEHSLVDFLDRATSERS